MKKWLPGIAVLVTSSRVRCLCVKKGSHCASCVPMSLDKCKNGTLAADSGASTSSDRNHLNVASSLPPPLSQDSATSSPDDDDEFDPGLLPRPCRSSRAQHSNSP